MVHGLNKFEFHRGSTVEDITSKNLFMHIGNRFSNNPYECIACHGQLLDTDEGVSHLEICYKFLKNMLELIPEYEGKTHMP